jgi:hypothetical protein
MSGKTTSERLKANQVANLGIPIKEMKGRELAEQMMLDGNDQIFTNNKPTAILEEDHDIEIAEDPIRKRNRSSSINSYVSDISIQNIRPKQSKIRNCLNFSFPNRSN